MTAPPIIDPFWLALGIRMLTVAAIVVAASFAVERAGPFVGSLVATLPLSAGPALAFLAADHGPGFLAKTALGGLLALPGTAAFILIYVRMAHRAGMIASLATALAGWAATIALLNLFSGWTLTGAFLAGLAANLATAAYLQPWKRRAVPTGARPSGWELAARAVAVMTLVVSVTFIGRIAGPHAAGLATLFPVVFTSLIALLHNRIGGEAMATMCAHAIVGMTGYGFGFALLALAAEPLGSAPALLMALAALVGWNGLVFVAGRWLARGR